MEYKKNTKALFFSKNTSSQWSSKTARLLSVASKIHSLRTATHARYLKTNEVQETHLWPFLKMSHLPGDAKTNRGRCPNDTLRNPHLFTLHTREMLLFPRIYPMRMLSGQVTCFFTGDTGDENDDRSTFLCLLYVEILS